MQEPTHVTIVSDNELSREGLKRLIAADGLPTSCASIDEAMELPADLDRSSHLILISADHEATVEAAAHLLRIRLPAAKIALICGDYSLAFLKRSLALGINGFLTKDSSFPTMLRKIRLVLSGQKVLPTRSIDHLVQTDTAATPADLAEIHGRHRLSDREIGILRCLADGDANKVISRRLNIAEPTVKVHIKAILRKLRVENRTQAAVWAISQRSQQPMAISLQ